MLTIMAQTAQLYYGTVHVGEIKDPIYRDGTWTGLWIEMINRDYGLLEDRLLDFIEFCHVWDQRQLDPTPPGESEFDQFEDLLSSNLWQVAANQGHRFQIVEAPMFIAGGGISWSLSNEFDSSQLMRDLAR